MNFHLGRRLFVVAAVFGALAVFAAAFFVALGVRSVVAGPDSAPLASPPNPGHSWSEIGDLPGTMWHSNNDGSGSGLDADTVDGAEASALEESAEIDADIAAHASNASAHHTKTTSASEIVSGTMSPDRILGTAWTSLNDGAGSGLNADLVDGLQANQIQDADDYVSNAGYATAAGDADTLDGQHASAFAPASPNPMQIALLRWYEANQTGITFPVGDGPHGLAFDGANIWVTNNVSGSVTKLRASDGSLLGTFAVGYAPCGLAFDGANIWVANGGSDNVMKLRASDGGLLGTFAVGDYPIGLAFDGANIWVANNGSDNVTKLRASDGGLLGTFAVGDRPLALAFDGANIWVANYGSDNVTKLRASDGGVLGTFAVGHLPRALAFDGANIWVANIESDNVTKLRASDGSPLGTFAVDDGPDALAFDGANIWVANYESDNVMKLRASDGGLLGTFAVGDGSHGLAFDGANIWVANNLSDNVTKL